MSYTPPLLLAALLASTGNAIAASSTDLAVRGLITPSACEPTISNGGVYDLGKISAKDLHVDSPTHIQEQILQLAITCEAATLIAIEPTDNRAGSDYMDQPSYYGLGLVNGDEKLGTMSMFLERDTVQADGVVVDTIYSKDDGLTWEKRSSVGPDRIISFATLATLVPIPVQVLTADLNIGAMIAPANTLTLTHEVPVDGSATLTLRYL